MSGRLTSESGVAWIVNSYQVPKYENRAKGVKEKKIWFWR